MNTLRMVNPQDSISVSDIDDGFMNKVLEPYYSHSRYLKHAWFQQSESLDPQSLIMNGEFSYPSLAISTTPGILMPLNTISASTRFVTCIWRIA